MYIQGRARAAQRFARDLAHPQAHMEQKLIATLVYGSEAVSVLSHDYVMWLAFIILTCRVAEHHSRSPFFPVPHPPSPTTPLPRLPPLLLPSVRS